MTVNRVKTKNAKRTKRSPALGGPVRRELPFPLSALTTHELAARHAGPKREPHVYDLDAVFRFIVEYKSKHDGNSPSLRDLMRAFDISATSVADNVLARLEKSGRIRRTGKQQSRCIEVPGGKWALENSSAGS